MNPGAAAAAVLVLVLGQEASDIIQLPLRQRHLYRGTRHLYPRTVEIELTQPPDKPPREFVASPTHDLKAPHPNSTRVFPGGSPCRHALINAHPPPQRPFPQPDGQIRNTARTHQTRPMAIIVEKLGYSSASIERTETIPHRLELLNNALRALFNNLYRRSGR